MIVYQLNKILRDCKKKQCESLPGFCFVHCLWSCTMHRPRPCVFFPGWISLRICCIHPSLLDGLGPHSELCLQPCVCLCLLSSRLDSCGMTPEGDHHSLVCASWGSPWAAATSACRTYPFAEWDLIPLLRTHSQPEPHSDPSICSQGAALFLLLPDAHTKDTHA